MVDISFYHLSTIPLAKALPRLLEKIVAQPLRVVVMVEDEAALRTLDGQLWSFSSRSFLPHGTMNDPHKEEQPIYVTTRLENPNHATVLAMTYPVQLTHFDDFTRVVDMFDGTDEEALKHARARWKQYQSDGHTLTYWKQTTEGGWQKGG